MINKAEKVPIKVVHVWMATWSRCFIIIGRPAHDSRSHLHTIIRRPFNQLKKCSVEDDLCLFPLSSTLLNILNVQFLQAILNSNTVRVLYVLDVILSVNILRYLLKKTTRLDFNIFQVFHHTNTIWKIFNNCRLQNSKTKPQNNHYRTRTRLWNFDLLMYLVLVVATTSIEKGKNTLDMLSSMIQWKNQWSCWKSSYQNPTFHQEQSLTFRKKSTFS